MIVARIAETAHRVVAARGRPVGPQVVIGLQGRNPDSLGVVVNEVEVVDVRRAEEWGKIAIRARSKRLPVAHAEVIGHYAPPSDRHQLVAELVVFVQILPQ